jgi:hypothetical protein
VKVVKWLLRLFSGRRRRLKNLEKGVSGTIHRWKCCWLSLQDENIGYLERMWTRMRFEILGARMELARVRNKDRG